MADREREPSSAPGKPAERVQRPLFERDRVAPPPLWVRTSHDEVEPWDRRRIVEALVREARVDFDTAEDVAAEVQRDILLWDVKVLTAPLVRELVNAKLIERGLEAERRLHTRVGVPIYNARSLILRREVNGRSCSTTPEQTDSALAGMVKREYALLEVYSGAVADAHSRGDLHLHGLAHVDRAYSCVHSASWAWRNPEFFDMPPWGHSPRSPEAFVQWLGRATRALRRRVAGSIGWGAVNAVLAELLAGAPQADLESAATLLLGEMVTEAGDSGGLPLIADLHLWWNIPDWAVLAPTVETSGTSPDAVSDTARRFTLALLAACQSRAGPPPLSPRIILHLSPDDLPSADLTPLLEAALETARAKGNVEFAFDHRETVEAGDAGAWNPDRHPAQWAMSCVTLNLPRVAYRAAGHDTPYPELDRTLERALEASAQKRLLLEQLAYGAVSNFAPEPEPIRPPRLPAPEQIFLVGVVGLEEMARVSTGQARHASDDSRAAARETFAYLRAKCDDFSSRFGMRLLLHQSPAETAASRLARLDAEQFTEHAERVLDGRTAPYYTNSTWLDTAAPVTVEHRLAFEAELHHLVMGRRSSQLWLGEDCPTASRVAQLLQWAAQNTPCRGIALAPEITCCQACGAMVTGLRSQCARCLSDRVEQWARVGGRMLSVQALNPGAAAEVFARHRGPRQYQRSTSSADLAADAGAAKRRR